MPVDQPIHWDQLRKRDRDRLEMLLSALNQLDAASAHVAQLVGTLGRRPNHPLLSFMVNGLHSYLHGFYMGGAMGVQSVLKSLGLSAYAAEIDAVLGLKVGKTTLRRFLKERRNVILAHPSFDPKSAHERAYGAASLRDPETEKEFRAALGALVKPTLNLYHALRLAYPEAAQNEDHRTGI